MNILDTQQTKPPTLVTAGVIFNEGKVLIAQRKKGDRFAGKWEFPGGKVEPKEKPKDCLNRPNCYSKIHILDLLADREKLQKEINGLSEEKP